MEFEVVIGLEIHAQMSTKTKMFCGCDNDSFDKEANINACPICMGFPGQLPVVNEEAVKKGVSAALALNCEIQLHSKFDRKNYFYPDNPKGFQISQYDEPVSKNGFIEVEIRDGENNVKKVRVGITRLHLEDDAGKLTHVRDGSLVDFNRAGTPLMEIVSEPDMHNAQEASAYAREIQKIVRYVGSSDADMEKGMMRFDASVSIRPKGETKLYPRAEIKNLNSFKMLENAIDYEIARQISAWEEGNSLKSPITMGWNDEKKETYFMRDKEESDDYRYFPEPDLPILVLDGKLVSEIKKNLPELPNVKRKKYTEDFGISEDEARILSDDPIMAAYFEKVVEICEDAKKAASFITTILIAKLKEDLVEISQQKISPEMMAELIKLVSSNVISNNTAKGEVFDDMYENGVSPSQIVEEKGLMQVSDTSEIERVCNEVIAENAGPVADVKAGKDKAMAFLVGQAMKKSRGKANPQMVNEVLKKLII
ncbi:Asp-tRNA(Asn)/Glu-tRNA(Gln) amidotransferase GatCAB subunit B [Candidatus Peregrinibacteria bacterium CG_4_10_14_0_2_um_filter_38_24]|nr:MAG: Asp-tRNA(Asn)/Glu-tRNA(Gln) amidotransferase GatCAB subunit B [Candidatus Peregrinibacteria bacterium CG_4_10_14_0_2_um_filter_38_24]PJC38599.1 MAG: Asp-tRNA(Asn)/Glu-tRNA(Gln) amidotransferase GatCAB subunit B [Candidatus Peregrinibacteria bacterium CG_4_9_14_0_2_um_filter_38_9]